MTFSFNFLSFTTVFSYPLTLKYPRKSLKMKMHSYKMFNLYSHKVFILINNKFWS